MVYHLSSNITSFLCPRLLRAAIWDNSVIVYSIVLSLEIVESGEKGITRIECSVPTQVKVNKRN